MSLRMTKGKGQKTKEPATARLWRVNRAALGVWGLGILWSFDIGIWTVRPPANSIQDRLEACPTLS